MAGNFKPTECMMILERRLTMIGGPAMNQDSIWLSLKNKKFRTLWLVTLISGSAVAAYNTAAVWLMNSLERSSFFISLIPVVTSLAFFLFTLPAGVIADLMNRTKALALINLGLAFLCFCFGVTVWLGWINPGVVLFGVLLAGIGLAFNGPAMAAIVPDLVSEGELSSAVTLGGLQLNISSMIGPVAGGLMILALGPGGVFLVNALCFLLVVWAALQTGETESDSAGRRDTISSAVLETLKIVRQDSGIRIVVWRSFIFSLFVSLIPALFPVLALRQFRVGAVQLGILFTSLAAGSVFGAVLVVPKMRMNFSSNAITILSSALLVAYYFLAGHVRQALLFTLLAPIGGIAWTVAASELWLVEQRLASSETRGRANAVYMLLSNAGLLLGGLFWGWLAAIMGLNITFHIATLAIMFSMPLCVVWSLDPVERMWRLAVRVSGGDRGSLVGRASKEALQVTFNFRVPAEARQRFEDVVTQAQADFMRSGKSHFRIFNVVANPCEYCVEIIFSSESSFREFECGQGTMISEAWRQTKECAVQTEHKVALIRYL
jgi:MFS family permease